MDMFYAFVCGVIALVVLSGWLGWLAGRRTAVADQINLFAMIAYMLDTWVQQGRLSPDQARPVLEIVRPAQATGLASLSASSKVAAPAGVETEAGVPTVVTPIALTSEESLFHNLHALNVSGRGCCLYAHARRCCSSGRFCWLFPRLCWLCTTGPVFRRCSNLRYSPGSAAGCGPLVCGSNAGPV